MGRARDISKVFSTGTALATDTEVSTTYQTKASAGLTLLTPGSITNTGGTASVGANGTVTFSGVASQSVNDVFSATYKNYKILIDHSVSTALNTTIRLRVSGADNTTSNYARQYLLAIGAGVSGGLATGQTSWTLNAPCNNRASAECTLFNPFAALATSMQVVNQSDYTGSSIIVVDGYAFQTTTSFTGFTIIASTGTITGQVSVYGYNE